MAPTKPRKKLSTTARVALWTGGGLVVVLGGAYAAGYALAGDNLPRNTVIEGVKVGGLTADTAQAKLREGLAERADAPLTITAGEQSVKAKPAELGLSVDHAASIAAAGGGRSPNPVEIVHVLFGGAELPAVVSVDQAKLDAQVAALAEKVDVEPADAALAYAKGEPKITPGVDGQALQIAETGEAVRAAYLHATTVEAVVLTTEPEVTTAEAEAAVASIGKPAISKPVKVEVGDRGTITIEPETIVESLSFVSQNGDLAPNLDAKKLAAGVKDDLAKLKLAKAKDARFTIKRGGKPKLVKSVDGEGVDPEQLAQAVLPVLSESGDRTAGVEVTKRPAGFTTDDAKAAGIKEVTGEFTTYFPGSAYRYNNIGKAARLINGTYVAPGETFSLNARLGERTAANGWMRGGGIANGRIDPNIYGGGISQATTTLFNAIFFAGLEDVYHKPHSLYFSRYPMGREATLDWRSVDLKFKNDSEYGVLLQGWTTGKTGSQGSVTIRVWSTKTYTKVVATKPKQSNWRAPGKTIYNKSKDCVPQSAMSGFDVRYERHFYQGKKVVKKEPFFWAYNSLTPVVCGEDPAKKKSA
ncbi:MAG: VanW family protein [Propionicimonas sp.]